MVTDGIEPASRKIKFISLLLACLPVLNFAFLFLGISLLEFEGGKLISIGFDTSREDGLSIRQFGFVFVCLVCLLVILFLLSSAALAVAMAKSDAKARWTGAKLFLVNGLCVGLSVLGIFPYVVFEPVLKTGLFVLLCHAMVILLLPLNFALLFDAQKMVAGLAKSEEQRGR